MYYFVILCLSQHSLQANPFQSDVGPKFGTDFCCTEVYRKNNVDIPMLSQESVHLCPE